MSGERRISRRELLKKAGAGAAAVGAAGAGAPFAFAGPHKYTGRWLSGNLSAITWVHFVPSYDAWLDPWAKQWGEANDVQVNIEHINNTLLDTRAAAEVSAQQGHDLFFNLHPMAIYEDQVIDHKPIVQEVARTQGAYMPIAQASTYNRKTKKYFAVSDSYVPDPVVWRYDLWTGVGAEPNTWENVLKAAPKLKKIGHPIGIGQSQELDSNMALYAFLMCFGSFLQDEHNRPSLDTKNTVRAVNFMAQMYRVGEDPAIFAWNPASNNQYLYSGTASLILNAISATRTPEQLHLPFSDSLYIWPIPAGPHGRLGLEHLMGCWNIWKFSQNKENAMKFLVDLLKAGKQATIQSQLYNFPTFAKTFPFEQIRQLAAKDPNKPHGKYTVLTTIAERYTHNIGFPGTMNPAMDEVFSTFLIPQMFAQVSQGKMSAAQSVASIKSQVNAIYKKWEARGAV